VLQLRAVTASPSTRSTAFASLLCMTPAGIQRYATRGPSASTSGAQDSRVSGRSFATSFGSASTLTSITLDGTLSSDGETRIDRYVWNCGNEFAPIDVAPDGSVVICRYRLGAYTATLNVTDQGTGVINPNTGNFDCQKSSPADSVSVIISTP